MHHVKLAPLGEPRDADYNPRHMPESELEKLVTSILEYGFVEPIVVREEDRLLLGGHQRRHAMRVLLRRIADGSVEHHVPVGPAGEYQRGRVEELRKALKKAKGDPDAVPIPTVYVEGLDDRRAKLLNLGLNRIHGEWDFPKLAELFQHLRGEEGEGVEVVPIAVSGFDESEVADLLKLVDFGGPVVDPSIGDINEALAAEQRKFAFKVETDQEAALVRRVLEACGMSGPGNAAQALVTMARCADRGIQDGALDELGDGSEGEA